MTDTVNVPREWLGRTVVSLNLAGRLARKAGHDHAQLIERDWAECVSMLAAAPKAEPVKTDPQIAFENMRRHFPNDRREWTDLTPKQRKEWEEDVSERPHLYDLRTQPEAPKVEQEPVAWRYRPKKEPVRWSEWTTRRWEVRDHLIEECAYPSSPAPASDELLELVEDAEPIIQVLLEDRETAIGGECEVARDLLTRVQSAIAKHKGPQS